MRKIYNYKKKKREPYYFINENLAETANFGSAVGLRCRLVVGFAQAIQSLAVFAAGCGLAEAIFGLLKRKRRDVTQ